MGFFSRKKLWRSVGTALCGMAMMAVVAGCGSSGNDMSKETLKVGVVNFADSLEPTENSFSWVVVRFGVGEMLTRFDEHMKTTPWLAESWTVSDDHLTWTFKIRDGVKFSNGTPLTAEAVKASIERCFSKSAMAKTFFTYTEMQADGQNLMIRTEKPMPNLPGYLADPLFLIVDVESEKAGRNFSQQGPIGTGPYEVESFTKELTVVKKNPNYWNGEVPYERIEIPSIDDPNTRAMALQSGDVDIAVNIAPSNMDAFRDKKDFQVAEITSLRTVLARLNVAPGHILSDSKVRAALISGADRKTYNEVLLKGAFIPGKAPIPPSMDYGFDQLTDPNAYNPERAAQLLDEAGWKDTDGDGIRDKDGKPLRLDFIVYNSRAELPLYAEATQADLKKLGFDINVKSVDYNLLNDIGIKGEYDLLISNILTANTGDPEIFLNWYWRTNVNGNNPQNGSGYSNPQADAKFAELAVEFDAAKRRQLIIDIQQILMNDSAALYFGYPMTNIVAKSSIKGVKMYPSDYYWITNEVAPK